MVAVGLLALSSAPAQAAEVARVELGTRVAELLMAPAGGAWVALERRDFSREIARVHPDGRFTRTRVDGDLSRGVVGPDGQAWFVGRDPSRLLRIDAQGTVTSTPLAGTPKIEELLATAPDGRVVAATSATGRFALIAPDAGVAYTPSARRACPGYEPEPLSLAFSAGASWMADGCDRLLYNGARPRPLPGRAYDLTPDPAGGVWMRIASERGVRTLAHAHPDGTVDYITPPVRQIADHAVAPDGSVWLALGTCKLARVTADGAFGTLPAPIPATQIRFDASGEVWLSNRARVARGLDGACDDVAPRPRVPRRVSLRALAQGIPVRLAEPATVRVSSLTDFGDGGFGEGMDRARVLPEGGTVRYKLPTARLREIKRIKRVRLTLLVDVEDRDGNFQQFASRVEVRR